MGPFGSREPAAPAAKTRSSRPSLPSPANADRDRDASSDRNLFSARWNCAPPPKGSALPAWPPRSRRLPLGGRWPASHPARASRRLGNRCEIRVGAPPARAAACSSCPAHARGRAANPSLPLSNPLVLREVRFGRDRGQSSHRRSADRWCLALYRQRCGRMSGIPAFWSRACAPRIS